MNSLTVTLGVMSLQTCHHVVNNHCHSFNQKSQTLNKKSISDRFLAVSFVSSYGEDNLVSPTG